MWQGSSEAQDRVIYRSPVMKILRSKTMLMMTPEPFLSAEIEYRREKIAEDFRRHAKGPRSTGRRFFVRRRRHLAAPGSRRKVTLVA